MTYQQTLDYLYAQLPMFSRIGKAAYKADLHNTIALCNLIGNPQNDFKCIHVAGTNGKGSVSHMLAAILQEAGYKTGLYTSPHIKDFRERIKINGEMISETFVVNFVEQTKNYAEEIKPSFFELTVAMAFDYFAKEQVDIAVIETGLGGRLDSTNIVTPLLSVITNIGYDHMDLLGDTLEKIATEKAGIIKTKVPVVIGEYLPETKDIFIDKAAKEQAPIHFAQDEFAVIGHQYLLEQLQCDVFDSLQKVLLSFKLDLTGIYQLKNLCTALSACRILKNMGFSITEEIQNTALSNVKKITGLYGRWDVIRHKPTVILEVAHNEDGIRQMLQHLSVIKPSNSAVHIVMGMVKDKSPEKILQILPKEARYYFSNAHIDRALPYQALQQLALEHQLNGLGFEQVNEAIGFALQQAGDEDIVIVCGSIFLISEVQPELFASI